MEIDIISLVSALAGTGAVSLLIVQLLKGAIAELDKRYGALSTQVVLLVVSIVIAIIGMTINLLPQNIILAVGGVFGTAMVIYEVLIKAVYTKAIRGKDV